MSDNLTTPFPAGTKMRTKDLGTDGHLPATTIMDQAGADAMGVVGASPAPNTLLGRLKAIVDALTGGISVTGTFFQATQPISAAALPLPAGAAKETKQDAGNTSLGSIDTKLTGVATAAKQDDLKAATAVTLPPFPITPHATNALERPIIGIAVKTAGTIVFHHPADTTGTDRTIDVPAGFYPMGGATHIRATSTATGLTGF